MHKIKSEMCLDNTRYLGYDDVDIIFRRRVGSPHMIYVYHGLLRRLTDIALVTLGAAGHITKNIRHLKQVTLQRVVLLPNFFLGLSFFLFFHRTVSRCPMNVLLPIIVVLNWRAVRIHTEDLERTRGSFLGVEFKRL